LIRLREQVVCRLIEAISFFLVLRNELVVLIALVLGLLCTVYQRAGLRIQLVTSRSELTCFCVEPVSLKLRGVRVFF